MVKYRVTYEITVAEKGCEDYAWDALNEEAYNNPDIITIDFVEQVEVPSDPA